MLRALLLKADGELCHVAGDGIDEWRRQPGSVLWLDIDREDPKQEEKLLREKLNLHPMAIQDAQRDRHPPKVEEFDHFTLLIYRGLKRFDEGLDVEHIQASFFVGANFLVSYHNGPALSIQKLWQEEAEVKSLLYKPAMMLARILRASVYRYLDGILALENDLSQIEDQMLQHPSDSIMHDLVIYRSRLRKLNRIFNYHERMVRKILQESTAELNMEDIPLYHAIQDVYDKCERLNTLGAMFYDQCGDLVEGHLSLTSHQLNKTMQALTVITAIFVPLGLLAGIYGMNFENIPELKAENGYFILLGSMAAVAVTLLLFFRRRGWI
jgi:magnesium transporter